MSKPTSRYSSGQLVAGTPVLPPVRPVLPGTISPAPVVSGGRASADTLRAVASPRESRQGVASEGQPLPLLYGRVQVQPYTTAVATHGGRWVYRLAFGTGALDAVESVLVDGAAPPAGVTWTAYLGSSTQGVDPWLAAAIPGYADTLVYPDGTGVAYLALRHYDTDAAGLPGILIQCRGLRVYDPRAGGQSVSDPATWTWSNNPALIWADFVRVRSGLGWSVDWASVADAASWCDELIDGRKRRTLDLAMERPQPDDAWEAVLRTYAGCLLDPSAGAMRLVPDRPVTPGAALTAVDFLAGSERLTKARGRGGDLPTAVRVSYTDTSVTPWRTQAQVVVAARPEVATGGLPLQVSEIPMQGFTDPAMAAREQAIRLDSFWLRDLSFSVLMHDTSLSLQVGDVRPITHHLGLSAKLMQVVGLTWEGPGRRRVEWLEYDPAALDHVVDATSTYADTTLPSPAAVPAIGPLTLAEELFQQKDGRWSTRLRATWTAIDYHYAHQYRVIITAGGVEAFPPILTRSDSAVTGTLKDLTTYTVTVAAVTDLGFEGALASATLTALGKFLPPGNVPQLTLKRLTVDTVRAAWLPAIDLDIVAYEVRLGAGAWEDADLVDRVQGLTLDIPGLTAGTHTVQVRALDSVGNYSPAAALAAITLGLPPIVSGLTGYETGGRVLLRWAEAGGYASRYRIAYGVVGVAAGSAATLDITDALTYSTIEVAQGQWDFLLWARDDAGQESASPARLTLTVTQDAGAFFVDSKTLTFVPSGYWREMPDPWGQGAVLYTDDGRSCDAIYGTGPLAGAGGLTPAVRDWTARPTTAVLVSAATDYGTAISGGWTVTADRSAWGEVLVQLELSTDGSAWTAYETLSAKATARYARLRVEAEAGEAAVLRLPAAVRVDAVPREETADWAYINTTYRALAFGGTGDSAIATSGLSGDVDFTVDMWARIDVQPSARAGLFALGTGDRALHFLYAPGAAGYVNPQFSMWGGAGAGAAITGAVGPLPVGRWFHVGVRYQASTSTWWVYLNGVQKQTIIFTRDFLLGDLRLGIGVPTEETLTGALHEVRVWSVTHTDATMRTLHRTYHDTASAGLARLYLRTGSVSDLRGLGPALTVSGNPQYIPQGMRVFLGNSYTAAKEITVTPSGANQRTAQYDNVSPGEVSFYDVLAWDSGGNLAAANGTTKWFGV